MKNGSFFVPTEQLAGFMKNPEMKNCEGLLLSWETDPAVARRILPPPLELIDPQHPVVSAYVVNIREPTFAPWYMEACIGLLCRYREIPGITLLNLQLSGPGALMGLCTGREGSGLPKKLCERIIVERTDDYARAFVEAKGRRIFDVEVELNPPGMPELAKAAKAKRGAKERGSCFVFTTELRVGSVPADGIMLSRARLLNYDNVNAFEVCEPGAIKSIAMEPSLDDPWAELSVVKPLYGAWSVYSNPILGTSVLAEFQDAEANKLFPYLFAGRFDRSTICPGHQRYGQF
ncbi:acetoacetate decarboxylase family protein [Methylocystis sp. IM3]|uniref:acetoacetate decarboxylase family protein n=1 Tax=unclassified Methylocystis TaxID=2625913 RepID=UPI0030FC2741